MAKPRTRTELKDYCLRKLGEPVIEINIDESQMDDRIDDALQFFQDYHFDGVEKVYLKHKITAEDVARRWIYVPDVINGVTGIFQFNNSNASTNMFDLRYQLRLHDLYDFTSVSYVPYEITMQHLRTLEMLFSGMVSIRFNRHYNRLYVDTNWNSTEMGINQYLILESYRVLNPDNFTIEGTVETAAGSDVIIGTGTTMDRDLSIDDEVTIGNTTTRIINVMSANTAQTLTAFTDPQVGLQVIKTGTSDVWNDRWLKAYCTALFKKNWGENLQKFGNVQLPGGVVLNGEIIYNQALLEIEKLEKDMMDLNILPLDFLTG